MKSALLAAAAALTLAAAPRGYADVGEAEAPAPRHHVYHEDRYIESRPVYREEVRVYRTVPVYETRIYRPIPVYPVYYPRPFFYGPRVHFLPPPPRAHFFFGF